MLQQIGAHAFAMSFMVGVVLCYCKKNGKILRNLLWIWFGNYLLWGFFKRSPYWIHSKEKLVILWLKLSIFWVYFCTWRRSIKQLIRYWVKNPCMLVGLFMVYSTLKRTATHCTFWGFVGTFCVVALQKLRQYTDKFFKLFFSIRSLSMLESGWNIPDTNIKRV